MPFRYLKFIFYQNERIFNRKDIRFGVSDTGVSVSTASSITAYMSDQEQLIAECYALTTEIQFQLILLPTASPQSV